MSEEGSEGSARPVVYLVATSHLDTQWRWTVRDTIRDYLPATLSQNFALFESQPAYVLSFEGAFRYMLVQEYYPDEYERLRRWVDAGRWRLAGSMLDAPDVNIPSPESLLRHILYGNGFFEDQFGRRSLDLFLPDCFGFGHALPSIAAHCGLVGFSAQKFGRWMAPAEIPFDLGVWEGPDGAGVIAAIRPGGYGEGLPEDPSRNEAWLEEVRANGERHGVAVGLKYFCIGDRGGAVGPDSIDNLRRGLGGDGPIEVVHSGSDQLFRDLDDETVARLPRHRGELLLPRHGTGCLTSQGPLKRWNRQNELLADAAERAAVLASWLSGARYPAEELREAWIRFLWHQMHDDLTGTSIPEAYRFTVNDQAIARNRFQAVLTDAIEVVAGGLDTATGGEAVVVFNPLASQRQDVVETRIRFAGGAPAGVRFTGPDGDQVPAQVLDRDGEWASVAFLAPLPSVGVAVFDVRPGSEPAVAGPRLAVDPGLLENDFLRAEVDGNGDLARLYHKRLDRELLSAPARLQLLVDRSTRWPAWEVLYDDLTRTPVGHFQAPAEVRIRERGPARVALEVARRCGRSKLVQTYRLAAGGERLEVDCRLEWRARSRLLKVAFPLTTAGPTATYDLGLGVIERGNNTPESYEVPAQQWADLADREHGVSILNDCKYGWDKPDDTTLRLTLARSPRALRRFRHQRVQDCGSHRFSYALYGHAGGWSDGDTVQQAARLNQPPLAFQVDREPGPLGRSFSFLDLTGRGADVVALKRAERGDEIVVRLRETRGRAVDKVSFNFGATVSEAWEVDGCERELDREAAVEEGRLDAELGPFALRSHALRLHRPPHPIAPPRSAALALPFDHRATSGQGQVRRTGFDGKGRSLPAELFPERLWMGGVELALGPADGPNCLVCHGQEIELPDGPWQRLLLVATAVAGDAEVELRMGEQVHNMAIQDWAEPIAVPPRRRDLQGIPWARPLPGYLKIGPIAWHATHLHRPDGGDEPYAFGYLYRCALAVPDGATRICLPGDSSVRIFAAAVIEAAGSG